MDPRNLTGGNINYSQCRWCGQYHGPMCYAVKALEFHADGVTVKRVEFKGAADYPQQIVSVPTVFQNLPDGPANTRG